MILTPGMFDEDELEQEMLKLGWNSAELGKGDVNHGAGMTLQVTWKNWLWNLPALSSKTPGRFFSGVPLDKRLYYRQLFA